MFKKMKSFINEKGEKIEKAFTPMLVAGTALGVIPDIHAENAADVAIQKIVNVVFKIFSYIGIILALWGAGSLILAFKNEDADSKTRAIMTLVVGISLVSLRALFGAFIEDLIWADTEASDGP